MPGLMYVPPWQPPALTGFTDLIQNMAMMNVANRFKSREMEMEQLKYEKEQLRKEKEAEDLRKYRTADLAIKAAGLEFKSRPQEAYKVGQLTEWKIGDKIAKMQYMGQNQWKEVASAPRQKPPSQNINISVGDKLANAASLEAAKGFGKGIGERVDKRSLAAEEGRNQNYQLGLIKNEIEKGARTGFGEETLLNLRSAAQTLGIDTGDLSGQELIRKTSNELALRLRNPESGLGLTGNTSNRDLIFLMKSVPGLQRTEAGNIKIIDATERYNKLKIAVAKKQSEIINSNNGVPPLDLDEQLLKFVDNYPLYTESERKKLTNLTKPIKRTGTINGRKVVEFSDGTVEYAD